MPSVGVSAKRLAALLGEDIPRDELLRDLERIGCDVDGFVEVRAHACPRCRAENVRFAHEEPVKICAGCGLVADAPFAEIGADEVVRMELLPDRPDLFDAAGLARTLAGYRGIRLGLPDLRLQAGGPAVDVDPSVLAVRGEIVCAVADRVDLSGGLLREIIHLQEHLHWAVGRDRKKASIGIHDAARLAFPLRYGTVGLDDPGFPPLGFPGEPWTARRILTEHPKGKAYAHLLAGAPRVPLLADRDGHVLALPPIINGTWTQLTEGTRRLFIDVTGTDRGRVEAALAVLCASLADYGATLTTVDVRAPGGTRTTPDLAPREMTMSIDGARKLLGVAIEGDEAPELLRRMRFDARRDEKDPDCVRVLAPRYRTDLKHEVDLIADCAIAHGYHRIVPARAFTQTHGHELPVEARSNVVRAALSGLGFQEVVTMMLTNEEEHCDRLAADGRALSGREALVRLANPASVYQTSLRAHLLGGLLATFERNKGKDVPLRAFEVGDVCRSEGGGYAEERRVAIGVMGPHEKAGYAAVRSALDALFRELGLQATYAPISEAPFLDGRVASVSIGERIGVLGEVHPEVLERYRIPYMIALAEIRLRE